MRFYGHGHGADELRDEDGILSSAAVQELCGVLGAPRELEDVLQQLRRRELRSLGKLPKHES